MAEKTKYTEAVLNETNDKLNDFVEEFNANIVDNGLKDSVSPFCEVCRISVKVKALNANFSSMSDTLVKFRSVFDKYVTDSINANNPNAENGNTSSNPSGGTPGRTGGRRRSGGGGGGKPDDPDTPSEDPGDVSGLAEGAAPIIATQLLNLAEPNGVTPEALIENEQYLDTVKEDLLILATAGGTIGTLLTSDGNNIQSVLYNLYKGETTSLTLSAIEKDKIIRYIETVAANNNISVEDLLTKSDYSQLLKDSMTKFSNSGKVAQKLANMKNADLSQILKKMFTDANGKLNVNPSGDYSGVADLFKSSLLTILGIGGLKNIFGDKFEENEDVVRLMLVLVTNILQGLAKKQGISTLQLLTTNDYSNAISQELGYFKQTVVTVSSIVGMSNGNESLNIKKLLNGELEQKTDEFSLGVIKSYLNYLCIQSGVSVEQLLDDDHKAMLNSGLVTFVKAGNLIYILSSLEAVELQNKLSILYVIDGKVEISIEWLNKTVASLMKIAGENKITVGMLLGEMKYKENLERINMRGDK